MWIAANKNSRECVSNFFRTPNGESRGEKYGGYTPTISIPLIPFPTLPIYPTLPLCFFFFVRVVIVTLACNIHFPWEIDVVWLFCVLCIMFILIMITVRKEKQEKNSAASGGFLSRLTNGKVCKWYFKNHFMKLKLRFNFEKVFSRSSIFFLILGTKSSQKYFLQKNFRKKVFQK